MEDTQTPSVDELTYKEASDELEFIVRALESGELELEDSLAHYTRGVALVASLRKRLVAAEQQVETLLEESNKEVEGDASPDLSEEESDQ